MRYLPGGPYWARTQEPLNCLVFILPIVVAYEIGVATIGTDLLARNQMQNFLSRFGATAQHLPAALVITVLLAWHVLSRRRWRVDATVLVGMLLESALLALPLLCIGLLSQRLAVAAAMATPTMPGSALTGE
ncbi:MAG: hypothetical protein HQ546_06380, partial [Planctomycetes bacterium]|nr:hypothetical protein [Planctomycetota bacterium]